MADILRDRHWAIASANAVDSGYGRSADHDTHTEAVFADLVGHIGDQAVLHLFNPLSSQVTALLETQGGQVILKLGATRPGEAEQLRLLEERGAAVPHVKLDGYRDVGDERIHWMMLDAIAGTVLGNDLPFDMTERGLPWNEVQRRVADGADFFALAHRPLPGSVHPSEFPGAIPFANEVGRYFFTKCLPTAIEQGHVRPGQEEAWRQDFIDATTGEDVLLHGDGAEVNALVTKGDRRFPDGTLVMLDPVTSYGPAELDPARWISRLLRHGRHDPFAAGTLIDIALEREPGLDRGRLCLAVAVEYRIDAWHETMRNGEYGKRLVSAANALAGSPGPSSNAVTGLET